VPAGFARPVEKETTGTPAPCGPMPGFRLTPLFAALLAAFPLAGGEEKPDSSDRRDWTRRGPILEPPAASSTAPRRAGLQLEVGEIAAIVGTVRVRRREGEREMVLENLPVGERVFTGDQFEIGRVSAAEIALGGNARLRLGAETILRLLDRWEYAEGETRTVQRNLELERGSARVRVKRNEISPSPLLLIAGNAVLMIDRSDAILERSGTGAQIVVLRGETDVVLQTTGLEKERKITGSVRLGRRQKLVLAEPASIDRLPRPGEISETEEKAAIGKLTFSIDQERETLPPAPRPDPEMQGP